MVDTHTPVIRQLDTVKEKLKADAVTLLRGDALASAQSMALRGQRFDLVFLDPPYQQDLLSKSLPLCAGLLADDGLIYVESGAPLPFAEAGEGATPDWLAPWEAIRADKAGIVFYHLLRLRTDAA
jgi:16S rRNA G966 N2-methylase RsmD